MLITGGAGFIGSTVADALLNQGHRVCVVDTFTTGRRENLADHPDLTIVEQSVADDELADTFEEFCPGLVIHAAASYKDPDEWFDDVTTNTLGTVNVVNWSQEMSVGRIIYFQTALCYGTQPTEQPVSLNHPLQPDSSYAISKTAGERYIALSGMDYVSLRLANAYGPRNLSGPLPAFFKRLRADQPCVVMDTRRDFVFIDDLLRVVLRAAAGWGHGVYHVASGRDFAIKDLFDEVVQAMGVDDPQIELRERSDDDAATILLDPSRTNLDFNWTVLTSLETGVARTIDWYQQHGVGETFTHLRIDN